MIRTAIDSARGVLRHPVTKPALALALIALTIAILAMQLPSSRTSLIAGVEVNSRYVVGATVLFLVHTLVILVAWQYSLKFLGVQANRLTTARVFCASLLTRYLPGGAWHLGSRLAAMACLGSDSVRVGSSLLLEQAAALGLCAALALLFGLVDAAGLVWLGAQAARTVAGWVPALAALAAVLLALYPPMFRRLLRLAGRISRRPPVSPLPSNGELFGLYSLHTLGLLVFTVAHVVVVMAYVDPLPTGPMAIAAAVLAATLAGFIAPFVPGGLGVRELALALLLQQWLSGTDLIAAAITPRVLLIAAEVLLLAVVALTPSWARAPSS